MNCPVTKFIDSKMQRFDPLWQAQNGVGGLRSRYYDKTGVAKYREWRGLHDTMVDYRAWLKNVMSMAAMVASAPIPCLKGFWEYRWMGSYLGTFMFIDRLFEGYRGPELVIAHMNMHAIVQSLTKKIALVLSHDLRIGGKDSDKIIPVDEVMPPLFLTGFKALIPIPLQTLPEFIICDVDQQLEPYYIDVAESFGLPADVCSRCAAETGVALNDDFPLFGKAMLSTNMPCNASEATSMFQRRRIGLPDYQATLAMIHNEPAALPFSSKSLLPRTAVTGASVSSSRRMAGLPISPAWMIWSLSASAANAASDSCPCVSEMIPMTVISHSFLTRLTRTRFRRAPLPPGRSSPGACGCPAWRTRA